MSCGWSSQYIDKYMVKKPLLCSCPWCSIWLTSNGMLICLEKNMTQELKILRLSGSKEVPVFLFFLHTIHGVNVYIDVENKKIRQCVDHVPRETLSFPMFSTSFCMFSPGYPGWQRYPAAQRAQEMGDTQLKTKEESLAQERKCILYHDVVIISVWDHINICPCMIWFYMYIYRWIL